MEINCLKFKINERFELSISDCGKTNSLYEALIWDKKSLNCNYEPNGAFLQNWQDNLSDISDLEDVINSAKKVCDRLLKK